MKKKTFLLIFVYLGTVFLVQMTWKIIIMNLRWHTSNNSINNKKNNKNNKKNKKNNCLEMLLQYTCNNRIKKNINNNNGNWATKWRSVPFSIWRQVGFFNACRLWLSEVTTWALACLAKLARHMKAQPW